MGQVEGPARALEKIEVDGGVGEETLDWSRARIFTPNMQVRGKDVRKCHEAWGAQDGVQIWEAGKQLPLGTVKWGCSYDMWGSLSTGNGNTLLGLRGEGLGSPKPREGCEVAGW